MQTPARLRRAYRGRHQLPVLITYRPTRRQAVSRGLALGSAAVALLALSALVTLWVEELNVLGRAGATWLTLLVPLPIAAVIGLTVNRRPGVRLDPLGVHRLPSARDGFTPWGRVADMRAERRRRRTLIFLYLFDGSIVRLPAPYDGHLLGRDPEFECKLFMIRHLWEIHRTGQTRG